MNSLARRVARLERDAGMPGGRRLPHIAISIYDWSDDGSLVLMGGREPLPRWGQNVIHIRVLPPEPETEEMLTARLAAAEVPAAEFIVLSSPPWPITTVN
jgi:hypothetical protein